MWKLQVDGVNQEKMTTTREQLPLIIITAMILF